MISSLQPSRPKIQPPPQTPLNQQPQRSSSSSKPLYQPPRNQIEAMPPLPPLTSTPYQLPPAQALSLLPQLSQLSQPSRPFQLSQLFPNLQQNQAPQPRQQIQIPRYDPATSHPVFFTQRFIRPPNGVASGGSISPVAMGYLFEDGKTREGRGKL